MFVYDTGVCPRCGSDLTGRLVEKNTDSMKFNMGSPIIYCPDPGEYNCACAECGIKWFAPVKIKKMSISEINQKRDRWVDFVYDEASYTDAEQAQIREDLYNEVLGIEKKEKRPKRKSFIGKVVSWEAKSLKKQAKNLAEDFLDIAGINFPVEEDEFGIDSPERQPSKETEE